MNDELWVAIVDDDPSVRVSLGRALRCNGIRATIFASAEEYLGRGDPSEPGCILLDVHLAQGLDGFDLKERLESTGTPPPIIFMTGQHEIAFPTTGEHLAVDFLCKPFETERLIACVQRHMDVDLGTTPR